MSSQHTEEHVTHHTKNPHTGRVFFAKFKKNLLLEISSALGFLSITFKFFIISLGGIALFIVGFPYVIPVLGFVALGSIVHLSGTFWILVPLGFIGYFGFSPSNQVFPEFFSVMLGYFFTGILFPFILIKKVIFR
jgi:hypothetical protein